MHIWAQSRNYRPGEQLFARRRLKFSGRVVEAGQPIPAEYLDAEKHRILWRVGHADHSPHSPYVGPRKPIAVMVPTPSRGKRARAQRSE